MPFGEAGLGATVFDADLLAAVAPDPAAPKGDRRNPLHQSDLQKVLKDPGNFWPNGDRGAVWAKTVAGTAFHLRMAAVAVGEKIEPAAHYVRLALAREAKNGMRIAFSKATPSPKAMARHVEVWAAAIDAHHPTSSRRRGYAELSFLFCDPLTGVWYEGDADLWYCGEDNELHGEDYKTGADEPEPAKSPQHHLYGLAAKYATWADAPHLKGVHQVDWPKAKPDTIGQLKRWPASFRYLWLHRLAARAGGWNILATATDGGPMNEADSLRYTRRLTADYFQKFGVKKVTVPVTAPAAPAKTVAAPSAATNVAATKPTATPTKPDTAAKIAAGDFTATLVRVVFGKADSDWKVLDFNAAATDEGTAHIIKVSGELANPVPGAEYQIVGTLSEYRGRPDFKASTIRLRAGRDARAVARILDSIKWFGPATAAKAIEIFGGRAIEELERDAAQFAQQTGMPLNRAVEARQFFLDARDEHETKLRLVEMLPGVHTRVVNKLWGIHGAEAPKAIEANPWALTAFDGIGWETADSVAQQLGCVGDEPARCCAGADHVLGCAEQDGNTRMRWVEFVEECERLLGQPWSKIEPALPLETLEGSKSEGFIQRESHARHEREIASRLLALRAAAVGDLSGFDPAKLVTAQGEALDDTQVSAVRGVLTEGTGVVTGGPGSGKTTTLDVILACLPAGKEVALAAPTGKAARNMTEKTGRAAVTIHSLLEPVEADVKRNAWRFNRDASNPLPIDVLVLDEVSMLDHWLAVSVLRALRPGTWLILIGDANQLQSVGPGDFLGAVVRADALTVHRLGTIHRNGGVGRRACASIIIGHSPVAARLGEKADPTGNNFWIVPMPAEEQAVYAQRIATDWARAKGFDPRKDVIVLSANSKKVGAVCAPRLNPALQAAINPDGQPTSVEDYSAEGAVWRIGDQLMQIKNNYDTGLINGDITTLRVVDSEAKRVVVVTDDGREVELPTATARDEMRLAYAATVHKFQGSQAPLVVICLDAKTQREVINRQWLYTAVSRFQRYCFLLCAAEKDVRSAIDKHGAKRLTGLDEALRAEIARYAPHATEGVGEAAA